jgi:hypothetical protein
MTLLSQIAQRASQPIEPTQHGSRLAEGFVSAPTRDDPPKYIKAQAENRPDEPTPRKTISPPLHSVLLSDIRQKRLDELRDSLDLLVPLRGNN